MPTPPGVAFPQRLIASILAAAATVGLVVCTELMGAVGSLLFLVVSVPVGYVCMRFGVYSGVGALLLTTLTLFGMYGSTFNLFEYVLLSGVPSFVLPFLLLKGWRWDWAIALSVAATMLLAVVVAELGPTVSVLAEYNVESQMTMVRDILPDNAALTAEQQRDLRQAIAKMEVMLHQTYVASVVIGVAVIALLQVWILSLLAGRHYSLPGDSFISWKAPELMVWGLIGAGALYFVADGLLGQIALNVLIVLLLVYYVQGLAIITEIFERRQFPTFLRVLGYMMALFFYTPAPIIVTGIGVFDLWIDFRKKRIKGN